MPPAAAVLCEMKYVCLASVLLSFLPSLLPCLVSLLQQYLYFCTGKASKLYLLLVASLVASLAKKKSLAALMTTHLRVESIKSDQCNSPFRLVGVERNEAPRCAGRHTRRRAFLGEEGDVRARLSLHT